MNLPAKYNSPIFRKRIGTFAELLIIFLWSSWVGRVYLDFDATRWPSFSDFAVNIPGYYPLSLIGRCGLCFTWNGLINGGVPTFTELLAAFTHPLVILAIWLFGYINGLKVVAVLGFFMGGLTQWWWAKVLKLGWQARLWSALLAVTAGHLAARMQSGLVEVILSIASCSLLIPAAVELSQTGSRKLAIVLGVLTGLAILSGQGYIQIGMIFGVLPALGILIFDQKWRLKPVWKEFILSGLIAVLISAVLWLPNLHFMKNYQKESTDSQFSGVQPISFQPLNLVIDDPAYYDSEILHKVPWPGFVANYIGWIPLLLILFTMRLAPSSANRLLLFFSIAIGLIYLTSSATIFKVINNLTGSSFFTGVRSPGFIQSLAIPLLLALAAWGVDLLQKRLSDLKLYISLQKEVTVNLSLPWLILILPMLVSLRSAYDFGQIYIHTEALAEQYTTTYLPIFQDQPSGNASWINPPNGDWPFIALAQEHGIKLTGYYHQWYWRGREFPPFSSAYTYDYVDGNITPSVKGKVGNLNTIEYSSNKYAYVQTATENIFCSATSLGGNVDVVCDTDETGTLIVTENFWTGWSVKRDGIPVSLKTGNWLSVDAPAGLHRYSFRYRPWDFIVGLCLSVVGWIIVIVLFISKPQKMNEEMERPSVIE